MNHDPKLFFAYIRSRKSVKSNIGPLKHNGKVLTQPIDMAECLAQCFSSFYCHSDCENSAPHQSTDSIMSDVIITQELVSRALKKLKISGSMGPDGIHPYLLSQCSKELAYPIYKLFYQSYQDGELPTSWKVSSVVPIFKKGERSNPTNYRPISLTSSLAKSMEKIVSNQLNIYLESCHLL